LMTEQRIRDAARALFSELGYDRTTIRAIAARAEIDPALVIQYFGSKDKLFADAARVNTNDPSLADPDGLAELLLTSLGVKVAGLPLASLATIRSMLTHPEAAEDARRRTLAHVELLQKGIAGEDAALRASLLVSIILGVMVERHLLKLDPLQDASTEQITRLLRPCFLALTGSAKSKRGSRPKKRSPRVT
jgi:AcrR family transcriptional regulator